MSDIVSFLITIPNIKDRWGRGGLMLLIIVYDIIQLIEEQVIDMIKKTLNVSFFLYDQYDNYICMFNYYLREDYLRI